MVDVRVDTQRLLAELERLAEFSAASAPAVTRVVYSPEDMAARAYLKGLMVEADLTLREDALGNTFAHWAGSEPGLAPVASGSHIDAIPDAGRYDGTVGVLGALEAIRSLRAAGFAPRRSIDLVLFTSEEPTRFGVGCLGSRALAGVLKADALAGLKGEDAQSLDAARQAAGFSGVLSGVQLPEGSYHAFVELHIEQGPVLERENRDIGVVTAIAAPATLHLTLTGEGGHAGAVLMEGRGDALLGAAEIALAAERVARGGGSSDSVATVGILDVAPRAVNSIPSRAFMSVDVRDTDLSRRDRMVEDIAEAARHLSAARGLGLELTLLNADPPAACDEGVRSATQKAADALGCSSLFLVSRAYHDALFMARLCPTGMIFIPCRDGLSHRPDEYASPEAIDKGVRVLAGVLAELSS